MRELTTIQSIISVKNRDKLRSISKKEDSSISKIVRILIINFLNKK